MPTSAPGTLTGRLQALREQALGEIHLSEETARRLEDRYDVECRGPIDVKGKGAMTTYFLRARRTPENRPN